MCFIFYFIESVKLFSIVVYIYSLNCIRERVIYLSRICAVMVNCDSVTDE